MYLSYHAKKNKNKNKGWKFALLRQQHPSGSRECGGRSGLVACGGHGVREEGCLSKTSLGERSDCLVWGRRGEARPWQCHDLSCKILKLIFALLTNSLQES